MPLASMRYAEKGESRPILPLSGVAVVFRQRRRGARRLRVALGVSGLLAATGATYAILAFTLFGGHVTAGTAGLLRALLPEMLVAQVLVLMVSAAVLGAGAAPPRESAGEIQAALLANVFPIDLCVGRLLAAIVTPVTALILMCLTWLGAQVGYRFQPADQGGSVAIVIAHVVLLCAIPMVGATGFYFALKRRPGRKTWRGITAALLLTAVCLGGLSMASRPIRAAENPVPLINGLLLIDPVVAAESTLHRDMLRWSWVYDRVNAADYEFSYPPPWAACGVYMGVAVAALALSAIRLRRAYQ